MKFSYEEILEQVPEVRNLICYHINVGGDPDTLGENILHCLYVDYHDLPEAATLSLEDENYGISPAVGLRIAANPSKDDSMYISAIDLEVVEKLISEKMIGNIEDGIDEEFEPFIKDLLIKGRNFLNFRDKNSLVYKDGSPRQNFVITFKPDALFGGSYSLNVIDPKIKVRDIK